MSAKVYTGIVFETASLDAVHALMAPWRERVAELTRAAVASYFADNAVRFLDRRFLGSAAEDRPLTHTWNEFHTDRQKEARGHRHPATDFEWKLTLYPFEGRLYGFVGTERGDWFREFLGRPGASEFEYYDNTDRPEDKSEAEWHERDRIWGAIFSYKPDNPVRPVVIDCSVAAPDMPPDEEILAAVPSFDRRVERMAGERVLNYYVGQVAKVVPGGEMRDYVRAIVDAPDWMKTAEGEARLAAEKEEVAALLPEQVTIAMLRADIVDHVAAQSASPASP